MRIKFEYIQRIYHFQINNTIHPKLKYKEFRWDKLWFMTKFPIGELSDFRSEMAKKKESYDLMLSAQDKLIEDFERRMLEILDENIALKAANCSLQTQIDQSSNKISSQDLEIAKIKFEHKVYKIHDSLGEKA